MKQADNQGGAPNSKSSWAAGRKTSIALLLPATIALLLMATVVVYGTLAYRTARTSAIEASHTRLRSIAEHAGTLLSEQLTVRYERLRAAAADPGLTQVISNPRGANREEAQRLLELHRRRARVATLVLRDSTRTAVLLSGDAGDTTLPREVVPPPSDTELAGGPVMRLGDRTLLVLGVPIVDGERRIGMLTATRPLATTEEGEGAVTHFIGPDAGLYLGNQDGTRWTDLGGKPHALEVNERGEILARDGARRVGHTALIPGTSLQVAVDIPTSQVFGPLDAMARPLVVLALLTIFLGASVAWLFSMSITRPLTRLTQASQALAEGGGGSLEPALAGLPAARSDEIGTLARAFRSMASRVQESREILEQQVDERTAELRDTLEQLREAQNELLVKERLAMLGQLSGSVGHELRNPLGVMSNAAYLLEKSIEKSPDKAREYAQMIRTQIAHSEKIVSDLLGFTRVRTPERTEVDVGAVISELVKQCNVPECVRVEVDVQANIPQLYADPVQVGQILQNLLANAAHAAEARAGGGVVTVRAGANDGFVRIDVMDNGTGIRADDMNRIFEPLFTTKARGIGLGLPLSRSLAEANGGQLTIESEFGAGSVATLVLPHAS